MLSFIKIMQVVITKNMTVSNNNIIWSFFASSGNMNDIETYLHKNVLFFIINIIFEALHVHDYVVFYYYISSSFCEIVNDFKKLIVLESSSLSRQRRDW